MPVLENYGQAIASTTIALQQLVTSTLVGVQVTTRTLDAARTGMSGPSVNLFLYRDRLASYREGSDPRGPSRIIAELHYLVSVYPGDDADTDAVSQRAYGAARAAIERHPVLTVPVGSESSAQVRLTSAALTIKDLTSLWLSSTAPLRLSFGVTASFALNSAE